MRLPQADNRFPVLSGNAPRQLELTEIPTKIAMGPRPRGPQVFIRVVPRAHAQRAKGAFGHAQSYIHSIAVRHAICQSQSHRPKHSRTVEQVLAVLQCLFAKLIARLKCETAQDGIFRQGFVPRYLHNAHAAYRARCKFKNECDFLCHGGRFNLSTHKCIALVSQPAYHLRYTLVHEVAR